MLFLETLLVLFISYMKPQELPGYSPSNKQVQGVSLERELRLSRLDTP